jgi:hypothetical protein
MPVSFAGPECESEGLKSPCAGDERHPQNYQQVTSVARAPSASAEEPTEGPKFTPRPRENRGAGTKELAHASQPLERSLLNRSASQTRHSGAGRNPGAARHPLSLWTPAFAGVENLS